MPKCLNIVDAKRRGEWAELLFMASAVRRGLIVCRPWGDSTAYDVLVDSVGRFFRVQVKSVSFRCPQGYVCRLLRGRDLYRYTAADVDFVAALVIPERTWYIVPFREIEGQTRITLDPSSSRSRYNRFKEAWPLLLPHAVAAHGFENVGPIERNDAVSATSKALSC